jgi:hypothetical protein
MKQSRTAMALRQLLTDCLGAPGAASPVQCDER